MCVRSIPAAITSLDRRSTNPSICSATGDGAAQSLIGAARGALLLRLLGARLPVKANRFPCVVRQPGEDAGSRHCRPECCGMGGGIQSEMGSKTVHSAGLIPFRPERSQPNAVMPDEVNPWRGYERIRAGFRRAREGRQKEECRMQNSE
jgi:hypothetical protein